jgi:hypothetical protein
MSNQEPRIDASLWQQQHSPDARMLIVTGIYVRAMRPDGGYESVDLAYLDAPSLLGWLKSKGGDNPLAEDVVGILLGHGHLHNY